MPAFGSPTRPMSAISRSSSRSSRSSPGSPFWACFGAWWVDGLEVGVAEAAPSATRDQRVLADRDEVGEELAGLVVEDRGPRRDVEDAGPRRPRRAASRARRGPRRRLEVVLVAEVAERRLARVDPEVDRAAASAVAAVGPAARDVGLAPERRRAVTARAGLDEDLDAVEEHPGVHIVGHGQQPGRDRASPADAAKSGPSGATRVRSIRGSSAG